MEVLYVEPEDYFPKEIREKYFSETDEEEVEKSCNKVVDKLEMKCYYALVTQNITRLLRRFPL